MARDFAFIYLTSAALSCLHKSGAGSNLPDQCDLGVLLPRVSFASRCFSIYHRNLGGSLEQSLGLAHVKKLTRNIEASIDSNSGPRRDQDTKLFHVTT